MKQTSKTDAICARHIAKILKGEHIDIYNWYVEGECEYCANYQGVCYENILPRTNPCKKYKQDT